MFAHINDNALIDRINILAQQPNHLNYKSDHVIFDLQHYATSGHRLENHRNIQNLYLFANKYCRKN